MILINHRSNYKQFLKDGGLYHVLLIDGGLITVYEKVYPERRSS
jgi:hypothetical protein